MEDRTVIVSLRWEQLVSSPAQCATSLVSQTHLYLWVRPQARLSQVLCSAEETSQATHSSS